MYSVVSKINVNMPILFLLYFYMYFLIYFYLYGLTKNINNINWLNIFYTHLNSKFTEVAF